MNRHRSVRRLIFASLVFPLAAWLSGFAWHGAAIQIATAAAEDDKNGAQPIVAHKELGPVQAKLELTPASPQIGDLIELKLTVTAEAQVELLMPEFGDALDRFAIHDFVPRESINDKNQTVSTQLYRLRPPVSGEQTIPPILIEFVDRRPDKQQAPEGMDAYELMLDPIDFHVKSVVVDSASGELKGPLGRLERAEGAQRWPWLVFLAVAALLIGLAVVLWRVRRPQVRRQSAYQVARRRLDQLLARPLPQGDDVQDFFVELSDIVRRYLEDRFDLRAPELTTEEFLETASGSPDLTESHRVLLREFLRQADLVKFAGLHPDEASIRRSLDAASRFLQETGEPDEGKRELAGADNGVADNGEVRHG